MGEADPSTNELLDALIRERPEFGILRGGSEEPATQRQIRDCSRAVLAVLESASEGEHPPELFEALLERFRVVHEAVLSPRITTYESAICQKILTGFKAGRIVGTKQIPFRYWDNGSQIEARIPLRPLNSFRLNKNRQAIRLFTITVPEGRFKGQEYDMCLTRGGGGIVLCDAGGEIVLPVKREDSSLHYSPFLPQLDGGFINWERDVSQRILWMFTGGEERLEYGLGLSKIGHLGLEDSDDLDDIKNDWARGWELDDEDEIFLRRTGASKIVFDTWPRDIRYRCHSECRRRPSQVYHRTNALRDKLQNLDVAMLQNSQLSLDNWIDTPASDEELPRRQQTLKDLNGFMEQDGTKALFDMVHYSEMVLCAFIERQPENPGKYMAICEAFLGLDLESLMEPLLDIPNDFLREIAILCARNAKELQSAWRGIHESLERGLTYNQVFSEYSQPLVCLFYSFTLLYHFQDLWRHYQALREHLNIGQGFCSAEVGDTLEVRDAAPIILERNELGVPTGKIAQQQGLTPITLAVPLDKKAVLLQGPNGGGKSTALDTIRLVNILGRAGFEVPVLSENGRVILPRGGIIRSTQRQMDKPGTDSTFQMQVKDLERGTTPTVVMVIDEGRLATDECGQYLFDEYVRRMAEQGIIVIVVLQSEADMRRLEEAFRFETDRTDLLHYIHMGYQIETEDGQDPRVVRLGIREGKMPQPEGGIHLPFLVAQRAGADRELVERAQRRWEQENGATHRS